MNLLTELNEAGTTIVMVTHSPSDAEYAHRIIRFSTGRLLPKT
jgi:putative ABC transport system ATP-binding protein